jgi:rhamnose utilization protein RhaD (predicted bifunctional aldolase and dehydrogenase)
MEDAVPQDHPTLDSRLPEVPAFLSLSARLGRDPTMIQASGGNTSCKIGDRLWIKASGKMLAAADTEAIFVAVSLDGVRQAILADDADPVSAHVVGRPPLRPSIETTLHALLPHRFVFHLHSVNVLSWTVREDGRERVAERLQGLNWAWVPYARPGLPLTRVTAQAAQSSPDILVLGNHGVVVGGADCAEVESRIAEVERRLQQPPQRAAITGPTAILAAGYDAARFRLPADPSLHALARDPAMLASAAAGSLYPDHVVFLGPVMAVATSPEQAGQLAQDYRAGMGEAPPCILVAGHGVVLDRAPRFGVEDMLRCLAAVLIRVPSDTSLRYLTADEIAELVDWDAEKYRKALNH